MTAQSIAPVIPSRDRPATRAGGRAPPVRRLPLAAAPETPALPDEVVYGFGRIDVPGRVGDRAIGVLGWQAGRPADPHRSRRRGRAPQSRGRKPPRRQALARQKKLIERRVIARHYSRPGHWGPALRSA